MRCRDIFINICSKNHEFDETSQFLRNLHAAALAHPHLRLALRLELVQVREDRVQLLAGRLPVLLVVQQVHLERLQLGRLALHLLSRAGA